MLTKELTNGVVIGLLLGFRNGVPLVVYPSNPQEHALEARSLTHLSNTDIGSEVALLFEEGRQDQPLIVGRILETVQKPSMLSPQTPSLVLDEEEPIQINSRKSMEFRCGKASIVMKADGTVTIRGTQILTRAERNNRIQGATISLN